MIIIGARVPIFRSMLLLRCSVKAVDYFAVFRFERGLSHRASRSAHEILPSFLSKAAAPVRVAKLAMEQFFLPHHDGIGVDILPQSRKSVIGFGSPLKFCDESRSHRTWSAAFLFAPPVFGGSNGRARALPVLVRASRSSNPFELPPPFGSECVGCCKSKFSESTYGCISSRACAISTTSCSP